MQHNFKIGDFITAYRKGIHKIVEIIPRYKSEEWHGSSMEPTSIDKIGEYSPVVKYESYYDRWGNPVNRRRVYTCDMYWCKPAKEYIEETIVKFKQHIEDLEKLRDL